MKPMTLLHGLLRAAPVCALLVLPRAIEAAAPAPVPDGPRLCRLLTSAGPGPEYYAITLRPTGPGPQASGLAELSYSASPFGVTVTGDGRYAYDMRLVVQGLQQDPSITYVVWLTPPNLSAVRNLGPIRNDIELKARVEWNKFLVFVTAEPDPKVERWTGKIVMTGVSRSGLMHTFMGHGPFESALC